MKNSLRKLTATLLILTVVLPFGAQAYALGVYTVKSGDSLWKIATSNGLTVSKLKEYNGLTGDSIYTGQVLKLASGTKYSVRSGDTLWLIAQKHGTTVSAIKSINELTSDALRIGQILLIPQASKQSPPNESTRPEPVYSWPSVTYIVQPGDSATSISAKFGVSAANIMKYNYMSPEDWFDAGEKIAINGYAPRNYAVVPGEDNTPRYVGKIVDWFFDGQYVLKRGDTFTITDYITGKRFKVKMMGGYNHSDVEPVTAADTAVMKSLYGAWDWKPRPVVIYFNGMNIAGSLSGMPHSFDTISTNNVSGHFDLYLKNSKPHGQSASQAYMQQHAEAIQRAASGK